MCEICYFVRSHICDEFELAIRLEPAAKYDGSISRTLLAIDRRQLNVPRLGEATVAM